MEKILRVGHSPDADDAFMFYAIAKGFVKFDGYKVEHVVEDIQSLNRRALNAELEVTAVSAAVYPLIADRYFILASGASVGRNYGPILVAKQSAKAEDLMGAKIAIPGKLTTAYLLLKIFLKDFSPVEMDFVDIASAVQKGEVDAGLLIHEGQLKFQSQGLWKVADLGEWWHENYQLPIPLGLDLARKDLGFEKARMIQKGLLESIQFAMKHEEDALAYAAHFGRGTSSGLLKKFTRMYVNQDTIDLGEEGLRSLEKLFELGSLAGVYKKIPTVEIIYSN